jgi:nicotinate-nucleotide pyrophosphorylase
MSRTVIALYRSHAMAHLVRNELERAGIGRDRIALLPGARIVPGAVEVSGSAITRDSLEDALYRLDDLHLRDSDTQVCRRALQQGVFVVVIEIEDASDLDSVQEVMDRPGEVCSLDEFTGIQPDASDTPFAPAASRWMARPAGGL